MSTNNIRNVRGGYRGRITVLQGKANGVTTDNDLLKIISKIETVQEKIKKCDEEILYSFSGDKEVTNELGDIDDYHDGVEALLQTLRGKLTHCVVPSAPPCNSSDISRVKLPKLMIKRFSGNSLEWFSFWETFEVPYIIQLLAI